jgi:hypothetical protein
VSDKHDITLASTPTSAPHARYTNADEFLSLAGKIVTEEVFVPSIDRTVIVKALTAADVQRARSDITETKSGRTVPRQDRDFSAMIAFYATVNPDGSQFFRRDQIDMLNKELNYAAIQPISRVALRLSGLDEEAAEADRKKHEEMRG